MWTPDSTNEQVFQIVNLVIQIMKSLKAAIYRKSGRMVVCIIKLGFCSLSQYNSRTVFHQNQFLVIIKVANNVKKATVLNFVITLLFVLLGNHESKTFC